MALGTATANVTAASTTIVPENYGRVSLVIVNDSDETIYLSEGGTAVVGSGIRINAAGGTYVESRADANHRIFGGAITAIHGGAGNKAVTIMERDEI